MNSYQSRLFIAGNRHYSACIWRCWLFPARTYVLKRSLTSFFNPPVFNTSLPIQATDVILWPVLVNPRSAGPRPSVCSSVLRAPRSLQMIGSVLCGAALKSLLINSGLEPSVQPIHSAVVPTSTTRASERSIMTGWAGGFFYPDRRFPYWNTTSQRRQNP